MRLFLVKKVLVAFMLVLVCAMPLAAKAAQPTVLDVERAALLEQLRSLVGELQRLQRQLQAATTTAGVTPPQEAYASRFFDQSFEAVYAVSGRGLSRIDGEKGIRIIDVQLFNLLENVVGREALLRYVDDFRVFFGERELSAFVETKAQSDKWFIAVNRSGYEPGDRLAKAAYIDLFLHEYAHLLLFEEAVFSKGYAEQFWTTADQRHSARLTGAANRFALMERYYDANQDRFVSDYATMSVDEDLAETFVEFVIKKEPDGNSVLDEKVRYFHDSPLLVAERDRLRKNLQALGVVLE